MGESLKEVIARMKAQSSQTSQVKPIEAVKPVPQAKAQIEETDEFLEEDEVEEIAKEQEKTAVKPQKQEIDASPIEHQMSREQQILMEIEMLQNNGRFRAELLNQLQEINKALVVIAGVLVDLAGANNGQK